MIQGRSGRSAEKEWRGVQGERGWREKSSVAAGIQDGPRDPLLLLVLPSCGLLPNPILKSVLRVARRMWWK